VTDNFRSFLQSVQIMAVSENILSFVAVKSELLKASLGKSQINKQSIPLKGGSGEVMTRTFTKLRRGNSSGYF
jgi:hypothetical protein